MNKPTSLLDGMVVILTCFFLTGLFVFFYKAELHAKTFFLDLPKILPNGISVMHLVVFKSFNEIASFFSAHA